MNHTVKHGNIASATHGIIVQQVNAQGVMGSGVAAVMRATYPMVFEKYQDVIKPNQPSLVSAGYLGMNIMVPVTETLWVSNIVGQHFYGNTAGMRYTSYDALDVGLQRLAAWTISSNAHKGKSPTIHYPLIGSGLGGGEWSIVREILHYRLRDLEQVLWLLPGTTEPS